MKDWMKNIKLKVDEAKKKALAGEKEMQDEDSKKRQHINDTFQSLKQIFQGTIIDEFNSELLKDRPNKIKLVESETERINKFSIYLGDDTRYKIVLDEEKHRISTELSNYSKNNNSWFPYQSPFSTDYICTDGKRILLCDSRNINTSIRPIEINRIAESILEELYKLQSGVPL